MFNAWTIYFMKFDIKKPAELIGGFKQDSQADFK